MIVKFVEKHGNRYVEGHSLRHILNYVLQDRINNGWYVGKDLEEARQALYDGLEVSFMESRRDFECENRDYLQVESI